MGEACCGGGRRPPTPWIEPVAAIVSVSVAGVVGYGAVRTLFDRVTPYADGLPEDFAHATLAVVVLVVVLLFAGYAALRAFLVRGWGSPGDVPTPDEPPRLMVGISIFLLLFLALVHIVGIASMASTGTLSVGRYLVGGFLGVPLAGLVLAWMLPGDRMLLCLSLAVSVLTPYALHALFPAGSAALLARPVWICSGSLLVLLWAATALWTLRSSPEELPLPGDGQPAPTTHTARADLRREFALLGPRLLVPTAIGLAALGALSHILHLGYHLGFGIIPRLATMLESEAGGRDMLAACDRILSFFPGERTSELFAAQARFDLGEFEGARAGLERVEADRLGSWFPELLADSISGRLESTTQGDILRYSALRRTGPAEGWEPAAPALERFRTALDTWSGRRRHFWSMKWGREFQEMLAIAKAHPGSPGAAMVLARALYEDPQALVPAFFPERVSPRPEGSRPRFEWNPWTDFAAMRTRILELLAPWEARSEWAGLPARLERVMPARLVVAAAEAASKSKESKPTLPPGLDPAALSEVRWMPDLPRRDAASSIPEDRWETRLGASPPRSLAEFLAGWPELDAPSDPRAIAAVQQLAGLTR